MFQIFYKILYILLINNNNSTLLQLLQVLYYYSFLDVNIKTKLLNSTFCSIMFGLRWTVSRVLRNFFWTGMHLFSVFLYYFRPSEDSPGRSATPSGSQLRDSCPPTTALQSVHHQPTATALKCNHILPVLITVLNFCGDF
jgi:hypothetical protein